MGSQGAARKIFAYGAALMIALAIAATWSLAPAVNPITPDSDGYLHYSAMRTAGYPALLNGMVALTGSALAVIPLQTCLSLAALLFMFHALATAGGRITGWSAALALIGLGASLANPYFTDHNLTIMTDSLFTAGVVGIFGCALHYHRAPWRGWIVIAGVLAAFLVILRPVSYAVVPVFFLWALACHRDRILCKPTVTLAVILPLIVLVAAGHDLHARVHGDTATGQIMGITLFGKAATFQKDPPPGVTFPEVALKINEGMAARFSTINATTNFMDYLYWHADNEAYAQYQLLVPELNAAAKKAGISTAGVMMAIGKDYIKAYPLSYVRNVATNYFGFWVIFVDEQVKNIPAIAAMGLFFLMGLSTLAIGGWGFWILLRGHSWVIMGRDWRPVWLAALFTHGYALLTVMTCVEVTRYAAAIFPVIFLGCAPVLYDLARRLVFGPIHDATKEQIS